MKYQTRLMPSYGRSKLMPHGKRVGTSLTLPTQGHPHPLCYGNFYSTGDTDVSPVTQSGGSICDGTNTIVGGTGAIVS